MNRILKSLSVALMLTAAPLALAGGTLPVMAQASDPAVSQVQEFYDALTASMKSGGTAKSRYEKLKPAVEKAFDLPAMTATAVGPTWVNASDADKKALIDAFTRMTVANYAKSFDSYNGEKFTVEPASVARGSDHFVKSTLKTSKETVVFNYRMHQAGSDWKITDVYLAGNISQMAQKRSDFAATLATGGPQGLVKKINALADQQLS
ncbi:MAG TPA: ABC transporter substrate-binding protein [Rhizomicrobium sp.]|jgi:phospholipid transport system substrate-binding protein|nr:ABC transporter substrate-binding protein [Rhizomicrobium sp.]